MRGSPRPRRQGWPGCGSRMRTCGRQRNRIRNEPPSVLITSTVWARCSNTAARRGSTMLIKDETKRGGTVPSSEITPKQAFYKRREFLTGAAAAGIGASALKQVPGLWHPTEVHADSKLTVVPSNYTVPDPQTPFAKATTYNNFYEFGT